MARDDAIKNRQLQGRASGVRCEPCWAAGLTQEMCLPQNNGIYSCLLSMIDRLAQRLWR